MQAPKYGTVERKLDIMKYICLHSTATMAHLAELFGVSVRTIMRDIDDIGNMVPIVINKGRYNGGVKVMDGYS